MGTGLAQIKEFRERSRKRRVVLFCFLSFFGREGGVGGHGSGAHWHYVTPNGKRCPPNKSEKARYRNKRFTLTGGAGLARTGTDTGKKEFNKRSLTRETGSTQAWKLQADSGALGHGHSLKV